MAVHIFDKPLDNDVNSKPDYATEMPMSDSDSTSVSQAIANLNPERGNLVASEVANDTSIMDLLPGTYQNTLGTSSTPYLPTGYGTLVVNDSGVSYKSFIYTGTDNTTYYRICHKGNKTWYAGWQLLAKKSESMQRYVNEELNYAGAAICSLMRNSLGKSEFMFLVEEKGTARFILTHCFYNGSSVPTHTQIANSSLALGAANAGGTQVINGCASGNAGEMRWTAW